MYKVVNEPPKPPSQVAAEPRPRFYDNLVAMALAKDPVSRFASARAFKQAIVAAVGQPIDETSRDATIVRSALRAAPAAAADRVGGAASPSAASARAGAQTVLAEGRRLLARHVGPLATVLVRRAASECETPSALYAKLAEQLTDPSARQAFLGQLTRVAQTTGSGSSTTAAAPTLQLSEALQERAQRLVTAHIGPIAKILVRKAAAQSRDRAAFVARLVEAVPEAARAKLIAELERVP
jgi:serine/threonine-protein kinase